MWHRVSRRSRTGPSCETRWMPLSSCWRMRGAQTNSTRRYRPSYRNSMRLLRPNAEDALREIAASMGIDRAGFDRAVADQANLDKLNAATTGANKKFGVAGTPSVFVNGQQVRIEMSFNEVAKAVIKATASLE
ncbi:hypothetical protein CPJ18_24075 [Agrobacterium rosae]|uniref:DSBA-like thioredoxin domain-containing protein n=2 Tax=Agrobacterium rosae TaxID=1972867 RepID=A0AAE5RTG3_9HYPH|nr:hypothetical protein DXM21_23835 [Agrobacterium rosae]KAA3512816.1 hypothetical protein DXM25_24030 [Agrobacterium rosae]MQB51149.1 hypothetical protein [Agrobacterium rosae]POO49037.1 hypothetical protein CPJ18_24075 [Agrobacterium rosae]